MGRGFTMFALWIALLAIGYDRFVKVGAQEAPAPTEEGTYRSTDGGDGTPPPPPCVQERCP